MQCRSNDRVMFPRSVGRCVGKWLDNWFGRGSYHTIRRLIDPSREYIQHTYSRELKSLLTKETTWLDVGCGHQVLKTSFTADDIELVNRVRLIVGCDLDLSSLATHRSVNRRVCCDAATLPFPDATFDVVSLNMVLEHLKHPENVFKELARIVKPEGVVVVLTPNVRGYFIRIATLGRILLPAKLVSMFIRYSDHRIEKDVFPAYYKANSCERLRELFAAVGIVEESVQMLKGRPLLYFVPPLCALELFITRLLPRVGLEHLSATNILGRYRRINDVRWMDNPMRRENALVTMTVGD